MHCLPTCLFFSGSVYFPCGLSKVNVVRGMPDMRSFLLCLWLRSPTFILIGRACYRLGCCMISRDAMADDDNAIAAVDFHSLFIAGRLRLLF